MAAERPLLLRASSACDSCAIRRVRCDAGAPCEECRVRSMRCTYFHTRKKRGPKGPRQSTTLKILELQRKGDLDSLGSGQHGDSSGSPTSSPPPPSEALCASMMDNLELLGAPINPCLDPFESLTLESYFHHLDIFHESLYSIWPVILTQELKQRMSSFPTDFGTYALAAAVCAATITQLGLPGNSEGFDQPSSPHFALIAQCAYQMGHAPCVGAADPVLLPFFLHVYFANTGNLRAAGDYLQRAVAALQWQQFNQDTANSPTDASIQHMELFCLVFNTERTFCIQNSITAVLTLADLPASYKSHSHNAMEPLRPSICLANLLSDIPSAVICDSTMPILTAEEVIAVQIKLQRNNAFLSFAEAQQINLYVTRQWLRLLVWEYTMKHFPMSFEPEHPAYSFTFPFILGNELAAFLSLVLPKSLRVYGYDLAAKIYRLADTIMDIITSKPKNTNLVEFYLRQVLECLRGVLETVDGAESPFVKKMEERLATLGSVI